MQGVGFKNLIMDILLNGRSYTVLGVRKEDRELCNKGCIDAHLKGNISYQWKRTISEWYVQAITIGDGFVRTFIFDEQRYKQLFND